MLKRILFVMLFAMVLAGCTTTDIKPLESRLDTHNNRISALERRVDALEQKMTDMDTMQQEQATEVSRTFERTLHKGM